MVYGIMWNKNYLVDWHTTELYCSGWFEYWALSMSQSTLSHGIITPRINLMICETNSHLLLITSTVSYYSLTTALPLVSEHSLIDHTGSRMDWKIYNLASKISLLTFYNGM